MFLSLAQKRFLATPLLVLNVRIMVNKIITIDPRAQNVEVILVLRSRPGEVKVPGVAGVVVEEVVEVI